MTTTTMSVTLKPSYPDFHTTLEEVISTIEPNSRVRVVVPLDYSRNAIINDYNWDSIENIQSDLRGTQLNPNVFATLRFDPENSNSEVIIDICHLPN